MLKIKSIGLFALSLFSFIFSCSVAWSQPVSVASSPVGIMRISIPNDSDTTFSIGFHRSVLFQTTVNSVEGSVITLNGTPGWADDSLQYQEGVQSDHHFLLFGHVDRESGSEEGKLFPIVSNTDTTLTLDLSRKGSSQDDPLENLNVGQNNGDSVLVVPSWTIATLFGGLAKEGIEIWVFRDPAAGANNASPLKIEYSESTGQWQELGQSVVHNDLPIYPGQSVFIRNETGQDQSLVVFGGVPMESFQTVVYTAADNKRQDIHIGIRSPLPISLADSGLGEDGDELLIFDNALTLKDKAASRVLEFVGDATPSGWYEGVNYVGDTEELLPAVGYILRKARGGDVAVSSYWKGRPAYLNSLLSN